MSSFLRKCVNPKTGKEQVAAFIDDYYGSHQYGILLPADGSDYDWNVSKFKDCDAYREDDINVITE